MKLPLAAAAALAFLPIASGASAATQIASFDSGWYRNDGLHIAGNSSVFLGTYTGGSPSRSDPYRTFFAFSTGSLAEDVTTATMVFSAGNGSWNADATETIELYDVTSPSATVFDTSIAGAPDGLSVFDDLGTGTLFGSVAVASGVGPMPEIRATLNAAAIAAINAARIGPDTTFIIGGFLASDDGDDGLFLGSLDPVAATLEVDIAAVPLPAGLPLLAAALGALGFLRRRRGA